MVEPFKSAPEFAAIVDPYPDPLALEMAIRKGGRQAKLAFARLWLSEGIPFVFKDSPWVYDAMRSWLSSRLSVDAKSISICGSGRLGSSLAPGRIGKKFDGNSDLDLFVVSREYFERLVREFNSWSNDYENKTIIPRNEDEERYWIDNNKRGPSNINRGFIDSWMIPNLDQYQITREHNQAMYVLHQKLEATKVFPTVKKISMRCYKSWDDSVNQTIISI